MLPDTKRPQGNSIYPPLTIQEIKAEIMSHLNLEKGLLFTLINFLKNPAEVVQIYLHQDRRKVQNPFRYMIIAVAFSTFITLANPSFRKFITDIQASSSAQYETIEKQLGIPIWQTLQDAQEFYMSYQNIVIMLAIPLVSLMTFMFFKNKGFNYAEHMAINCFVFGTVYWLSGTISLLTFFMEHPIMVYVSWFLVAIFGAYFYSKIFKIHILKSFLTVICAYFPITIVGMIFQFTTFFILLLLR